MDAAFDPKLFCMGCMERLPCAGAVCPVCGFDNTRATNEPHQLPVGTILSGKYLVGRALGQGGFGVTYIGWDLNLDIKVAVKEYYPMGLAGREQTGHATVLPYTGAKSDAFRKGCERFVQEARVIAKFSDNPSIVHVRDYFRENGTAYIVMEFVSGKTLQAIARERGGRLPARETLELLHPLLPALAEVHAANLLHRDISPDNIILQPNGRIKLLDFGAARQISAEGEHSNTINVKHGFAPVEQYSTHGEQGPWTDVYALCATIYRLTTGQKPPQATDRAMFGEPLVPPNDLGAGFTPMQQQALLRGLTVQPKERTRDMAALEKELFGEARPVFATPKRQEEAAAPKTEKPAEQKTPEQARPVAAKPDPQAKAAAPKAEKPTEQKAPEQAHADKNNTKLFVFIAAALVLIVAAVIGLSKLPDSSNLSAYDAQGEQLAAQGQTFDAAECYVKAHEIGKARALFGFENQRIAAGHCHTIGLKADGTVVAIGDYTYGQREVQEWKDIVAVAAGTYHTVGLKADGTVVSAGTNDAGECDVQGWEDVVAVAAGSSHTIGLKADGTVVAVGYNYYGQCDVQGWKDVVAIAAGALHTVGLKSDGTVVAVGCNDDGECDVQNWKNIIAVAAGTGHTVGLKADGTVVAVGSNALGQCNVQGWKDVVAVAAGTYHTVGLKADGAVVAVGYNGHGQCNVQEWKDVVAVAAGGWHTVGLKADGTVVAVGDNSYGQCDVQDWNLG